MFSASVRPLERIRAFSQNAYDSQVQIQKEHGCVLGCPGFSLGSEIGTQDETIRAKVQEILQRQIRYFESAIRDGQADGTFPQGDAAAKATTPPETAVYTATKGAVDAITRVLSKELGARKIRVDALNPGHRRNRGSCAYTSRAASFS